MEKKIVECNANTCQYHALTEGVVKDLRIAVQRIMEGQEQMRDTVIQLTEAFKAMERIDKWIDKHEDTARLKDAEQDKKIDDLRVFMYKAIGAIAALGVALSFIMKLIGMVAL